MRVVGIDLGTTNTVVGVVQNGRAVTLADAEGRPLVPSMVSFSSEGHALVGHAAKERRLLDPKNTIYSFKRLIGRSFSSEEVTRARLRTPFEIRQGAGDSTVIFARQEAFTVPEVAALILQHAKAVAERALGEAVQRAIVTVPANFNDLQRGATKLAGRIAGLDVMRILNEPTAAALAYGYGKESRERIAIYDFGGGTFDVTVLQLAGNVFEVLATAGNSFLGGDDIDVAIAERMAEACIQDEGFDPRDEPQAFERLRLAAENMKISVATADAHTETIASFRHSARKKPFDLSFTMSRSEIDELARPIVDRTFEVCRDALEAAGIEARYLDEVVLVGGSTRLPLVKRLAADFFGRKPLDHLSPDEVVALGAGIQANTLATQRRSAFPKPPAPSARSSSRPPRSPVPPARRVSPAPVDLSFTNLSKSATDVALASFFEEARGTNTSSPSNASALPLLVDVTPLSLSVETVSGYCDVIIKRNTPVPCAQSRTFVTSSDNQTIARVRVGQGESAQFDGNTLLGELELTGLPAMPRGETQVVVTFSLDTDGILSVTAAEPGSGVEREARLKVPGADNPGGNRSEDHRSSPRWTS